MRTRNMRLAGLVVFASLVVAAYGSSAALRAAPEREFLWIGPTTVPTPAR